MNDHEPEPNAAAPVPLTRYRARLRALYEALDRDAAGHAPVCRLSGRCCRFEEYGHTLFLSEPEAELLLNDAPPPARPLDGGATCPWQDPRGHCTARDARPLGCRVYYCDPAFAPHAAALSETYLTRLKRLADELDLPWGYAPLHHHLRRAAAGGRLPTPPAAAAGGAGAGFLP